MAVTAATGVGNAYAQLTDGKRIHSAADDAAGLAIAEKLESQSRGYDMGTYNAENGKSLLNIAEGGLDSISESLQRMRELSLQAGNSALYTDSDRKTMQDEIEQLKASIQDAAKNTKFNTMSLLDGSKADWNLATNPNGSGMKIQMTNATLEALGIADYDLTGDYDIEKLDDAIKRISDAKSAIGASGNALDAVIQNNNYTSYHLKKSESAIEDEDMGKAVSEMEKERILEQYKTFAMKEQMGDAGLVNRLLN